MTRISLLAAAAALCIAAQPALATSSASASASLTNLTVTLYDLNPLDGIAPSLTFQSYGSYDSYGTTNASHNNADGSSYAGAEWGAISTSPWQVRNAMSSTLFATASSSVSGPGTLNGSSLLSTGAAVGPGAISCTPVSAYQGCGTPSASFSAQVVTPYYYYAESFTLSANTLALFSATASVTAEVQGGGQQTSFDYYGNPYTFFNGNGAYAQVALSVSGPSASGGGSGSQQSSDSLYANAYSYWDGAGWVSYGDGSGTSTSFAVSFVNASAGNLSGNFQASTFINGNVYDNSIAAVPEPGTVAMMLAGLAIAGGVASRRRRAD